MLRTTSPVRALSLGDSQHALAVCAQDPVANVFVAARIMEGGLNGNRGAVLGFDRGGEQGLIWTSANVVPVQCTPPMIEAFAEKVAKRRRWASSVFGPADPVLQLWSLLEPQWGRPREIRSDQPLLVMHELPSRLGIPVDPLVRPAQESEIDLVLPAAEAMFTEEIGYPPYRGSDRAYRLGVEHLVRQGRTLVRVEDGRVVFKADLGSVAIGVAQVQGVWVHPDRRGQGLAAPAMAAVVEQTIRHHAPQVSLYVNSFNAPALATYRRVGFVRTGTFATVLL
jgi:predicted GNAT family acetyltransferase